MRVSLMVQIRIGSYRLPAKALKEIAGKPLVWYVLNSLKKIKADDYVLVTEPKSADALKSAADEAGFEIFCGPEDDVLKRYALAVKEYDSDIVIRATGDNPFVSINLADMLLEQFVSLEPDYAAYKGNPVGTGVEIVKAESLLEADSLTQDSYCREHVNPYLYQNPEKYDIYTPEVAQQFYAPDLRVTVDTPEDLSFVRNLIESGKVEFPFDTAELIKVCREHNFGV